MSELENALRAAFVGDDVPALDPAAVYARVEQLTRIYRWRRRGAHAVLWALVGIALVLALRGVPIMRPGDPVPPGTVTVSP